MKDIVREKVSDCIYSISFNYRFHSDKFLSPLRRELHKQWALKDFFVAHHPKHFNINTWDGCVESPRNYV